MAISIVSVSVKRKRSNRKRRLATAFALALLVVSSVHALTKNEVREPVVRFIDFYIAAQKADAPMSLWERIMYSLAMARGGDKK